MISNIKTTCSFAALLATLVCSAQHTLFSENFEDQVIRPTWQVVNGDWAIGDVQEMRIAPAEDGRQYVLLCSKPGYVRLMVDIPDSLHATRLRLRFAYYTFAQGPGLLLETEFQKKGWKDGLRGNPWEASLPVKSGQWSYFQKDLLIPKEGNVIWLTFSPTTASTQSESKTHKLVCLDAISITALPKESSVQTKKR